MSAVAPFVVPLSQLTRHSIELAGGKGANLGDLVREGFDVPDAFVVTTAAYTATVAGQHVTELLRAGDPAAVTRYFETVVLPTGLAEQIVAAYAALGTGPVAVRSSATTEDLPGASFAGQQDTLLNVTGDDAVLAAVRHCWASLWGERAVAYRATHAADADPRIAVVVQRLVPAEVAGVMFTADPATGRRDQVIITAAWGLGEAVVSGQVEPDEYVVGPGASVRRRIAAKLRHTRAVPGGTELADTVPDRARRPTLTDGQARALAALGVRVAEHFGTPQDIEWTLADDRFALVQARPITALPEPAGVVPTEWPLPRARSLYFRASIVEQLPDPLTPLFADLIRSAVPAGLDGLRATLSPRTRPFDVDFPTINGYAYYDYSRRAMNTMWSLAPQALRLLASKDFVLHQWRDTALPAYRRLVEESSPEDPAAMPAEALLNRTQQLLDAACRYYSNVQLVIPMAASTELIWTAVHDSLLRRPDGPQASDFLLGYDSAPIRAEKALHQLVGPFAHVPGLIDALRRPDVLLDGSAPAGVNPATWDDFKAGLDEFLAEFGHTVSNLDFVNPVPADDPGQVVTALRHALSGTAGDPVIRQRAAAERRESLTRELLDRLDPVRRRLTEATLRRAQQWTPLREDALAAVGLAWPVMRRLLRELGRRIVTSGALDAADDVFWLSAHEARAAAAALDAGTAGVPDLRAEVADRRMRWRGQVRATPPQYLPEIGWMKLMEDMMPAAAGEQTGPVLRGTGGSGGRVTAPARVLSGPADFARFEPGEVLVAAITTPAYTPLFGIAAGVVTDIGGVLSHGSIVAREYGIPAVLGTGTATKRIATGQVITVDGTAGVVRLAEAEPDETDPSDRGPTRTWWLAAGTAAVLAAIWYRRRFVRRT